MIEFRNEAMRKQYHKMNGITVAYALEDTEEGWTLYFGGDSSVDRNSPLYLTGFPEGNYSTEEEALEAAAKHHPELRRVSI